jgi:N-acetylmuramoyl-L-alanine amidase
VRGVLLGGVALVLASALAPAGHAASPTIAVSASAPRGLVPFAVTFTASGDATAYHWELGDGSVADGPTVAHTYARPGAYVAVVTATGADGSTSRAEIAVSAHRLALGTPTGGSFGRVVRFRGSIAPTLPGANAVLLRAGKPIARARLNSSGRFAFATRLRAPGPYRLRIAELLSAPHSIAVRPELSARLVGTGAVGQPLTLVAGIRPARLAVLRVRVWRGSKLIRSERAARSVRVSLPSGRPASFRMRVDALRARGALPASRRLTAAVVHPQLGLGSRGPSVLALEQRLRELHYALQRVDALYDADTVQAVLAFQKVNGLAWTGRVDARVWRRLLTSHAPRPRAGGDHIEVYKRRQVLFVVRAGRVELVVHISTGATGNTPVGRWHVYRKVVGWDWVLWYPMYFVRGFAIHGYPSVPSYPASHGCVRVPMWVAPRLFAGNAYGTTVDVYA